MVNLRYLAALMVHKPLKYESTVNNPRKTRGKRVSFNVLYTILEMR